MSSMFVFRRLNIALNLILMLFLSGSLLAQNSWTNWESPPVHPLEKVPGTSLLLAVNTADGQLEVHDLASGLAAPVMSIPVGLDPVSVRALSSNQAWVVNRISDSISIVDLDRGVVEWTILTPDEPADVVFAGDPLRAFVSCSGTDQVLVFDPLQPRPESLATLEIIGEEPRALAVSPDGMTVYCAIFESGNATTILGGGLEISTTLAFPPNAVNHSSGPYGGVNPPPNAGNSFEPPVNPLAGTPPPVGLIVRRMAPGVWMDDNGGDWSSLVSGPQAELSGRPVGWDLTDHDVAVIDTSTLSVSYIGGLMNICMSLSVRPVDGALSVIGTEAHNEIRYEPNLNGNFIDVLHAFIAPGGASMTLNDLNPHLPDSGSSVPVDLREISMGDPRALVWDTTGDFAYVAGKGSNNVIRLLANGERDPGFAPIDVGAGATGLVLEGDLLYVHEHFDAAVSQVDLSTGQVLTRVSYHDPTPVAVKEGRSFLYDTHMTSGMGQVSCASCHVDARTDRLSWDLGDPSHDVELFTDVCNMGLPLSAPGACEDFHPMKGPMLTQTMQDIIGKEPHHWRGDRAGIEAFGGAFMLINGDDQPVAGANMQLFEDFLASIHFPPNPHRNLDNTLPAALELEGHFTTGRFGSEGDPLGVGNAVNGLNLYRTAGLDGGLQCVTCHTLPIGIGPNAVLSGPISMTELPDGPNGEKHHGIVSVDGSSQPHFKIPQLRNIYKRSGFNTTQMANTNGFGFLHDGSVDSIERFLSEPAFDIQNNQELADLVAFMLAFSGSDLPDGSFSNPFEPLGSPSQDSHAAVGKQITLDSSNNTDPVLLGLIEVVRQQAAQGKIGLIARQNTASGIRGYVLVGSGSLLQSDRASESVDLNLLMASASNAEELTIMAVPISSAIRLGIDRDMDGAFNGDEILGCSDPADPTSLPGSCGQPQFIRGDGNLDSVRDISDVISTLTYLFGGGTTSCEDAHDSNDDGALNIADPVQLLGHLFSGAGELPLPGGTCGGDPTVDSLGCDASGCP